MNFVLTVLLLWCCLECVGSTKPRIRTVNSYNPGSCNEKSHGREVLVKDRSDGEILLACVKHKGIYNWRATDGSKNTIGEYFDPGLNCSDILNKLEDANDGFYWITLTSSNPIKVYCDMTTDGGGFMLVGRKNNSITWAVPSNNMPVEPYGEPHWSSSLGDAPIMDFRIQMATSQDFKATKAHWSFRLRAKRPLKKLMMNSAGCDQRSAGVGDIGYVKDLMTERIVTTKLRCSKFGFAYHHLAKFGWSKMNSCLQKPCKWGFAFHDVVKFQLDYYGGFSYSTTRNISGMEYKSTAFVGCDNGNCCGCYGPAGGTKDYCAENCQAINGGTVTKTVFTWFWVRSSLPKRIWKKCMDYQVRKDSGKFISYKLVGHSVIPSEGNCSKDSTLLYDGIVMVPDSSVAQKVPAVDGLLLYRKDNQELYVRSNKTWNALATENKILRETVNKDNLILAEIKKLDGKLKNEKNIILQETRKKHNLNFARIIKLQQSLQKKAKLVNQNINQLRKSIKKQESSINQLKSLSPCFIYQWLNEGNRNEKYSSSVSCDGSISGWYRFGGGAGIKMPTSCVPKNRCGTDAAGWMNGDHPRVSDGKVTRKVCYNWSGNCCNWSNNIEVVNCGLYYVYKLSKPPTCSLRYCGSYS